MRRYLAIAALCCINTSLAYADSPASYVAAPKVASTSTSAGPAMSAEPGQSVFGSTMLVSQEQLPAPGGETPEVEAAQTNPVYTAAPSVFGSYGCECRRAPFQSDNMFPRFSHPVTNPVFSKDPRSMTEARFLFINNQIDRAHPLGNGNFQVYALQLRIALTERLTLIADKDGYAVIHPGNAPTQDGWLNLGIGLRYLLIRDVQNQFLWSAGFMFEPQSGEASVFQSQGDGTFSVFTTMGKEFNCVWHLLGTVGYQFPVDASQNSSYVYTSLHADRLIGGWFAPLVEMNWFHWTDSGNRGVPAAVGEGDGLLNIGTSGVAGSDLVTVAVGANALLSDRMNVGAAWEVPVAGTRHKLLNNRLTVQCIVRY